MQGEVYGVRLAYLRCHQGVEGSQSLWKRSDKEGQKHTLIHGFSNLVSKGHYMTFISMVMLILLYALSVLNFRAFGGPLGQIPGPLEARVSRLWMIKHSWKGYMHRSIMVLHKRHGKFV